jgi:hypothetical protein
MSEWHVDDVRSFIYRSATTDSPRRTIRPVGRAASKEVADCRAAGPHLVDNPVNRLVIWCVLELALRT